MLDEQPPGGDAQSPPLTNKRIIMDCGKIIKNLMLAGCGASIAALASELVLLNFADIDKEGSTVKDNVISTLLLNTGAKGVKYESAKKAFEGSTSLNKGTYLNTYNHQVLFRSFVKSQDVKDELNRFSNGRFVAIVKNLDGKNPETTYEVYGWDSGLVLSDFQSVTTDTDGVFYTVTLASDDDCKESELPKSLFSETLKDTETMIKGLIAETSVN